MAHVVSITSDELLERREAILTRLGISAADLARFAEAGSLVGDEWEAWQDLCDITFLLGDD